MKYTRIGSRVVFGALTSTLLAACGSIPRMDAERYVTPLSGATVTANLTNYTRQLDCLGNYLQQANLPPSRFAVGRVEDYSGKQDLVNGKRMTQGAALMVISALAHTRLPIVERLDTSVAEMELKYTDNKLIGDATPSPENPFRRTVAGTVIGSDYHIVGGITEVNYNIRSGSLETTVSSIGASGRYAVLDVAIDLRLVNTRTLQVVGVASVQKQIIGTEIRAGIFRFLSDSVIDINAADKAQEPIQKAVRMLTERAVFQLVSGVYKVPAGQCDGPAATTQTVAAVVPTKAVDAISTPAAQSTPATLAPSDAPALQPPVTPRTPVRKTADFPAPISTPGAVSAPSSLALRLSDAPLLSEARVQSTPAAVDLPATERFAAAPVVSANATLEMVHTRNARGQ
ncbi:MAG: hypothetical protein H7234_00075 [Herminiimonas sp.]|nr:hypothetical protein [Herminiimonas sp.]